MKYGTKKYGSAAYGPSIGAVFEPSIVGVTVTPNPVNINTQFVISVSIAEIEVVMYNRYPVAGATISGETVRLKSLSEVF